MSLEKGGPSLNEKAERSRSLGRLGLASLD
jgi:hypothetical protein